MNLTELKTIDIEDGVSRGTPNSLKRVVHIEQTNDTIQAYLFNGTDFKVNGDSLTITGAGQPTICKLTDNTIAYYDNGNDELRAYEFDLIELTWSQIGNSLSISSTGKASMAFLEKNLIAYIDVGNDLLSTYSWDGTDFSLEGNTLSIVSTAISITGLTNNLIALFESSSDELRTYSWDGTDWSLIGNQLTISNASDSALASQSSSRVAFIDQFNDDCSV